MEYIEIFEANADRTQPRVKGTDITLTMVLDKLLDGKAIEEILTAFPELTREKAQACLRLASQLVLEGYAKRAAMADKIRKLRINPE